MSHSSQLQPRPANPGRWDDLARWALLIHVAANGISAVAFATFLVEPYPAWLATPRYIGLLEFGLKWGGQVTVVLGAVAGIAFAASRIGARATWIALGVVFALSLVAELCGTHYGLPFGVYAYTDRLGYKILGLVPFNIPASWFYMVVCGFAICARLLPATDDATSRWWWALVTGLLLVAWDVLLDPAMVKTYHWFWNVPDLSAAPAFQRFIGAPVFYGMPITNWLGWLLTGTVVARAALAVVPPSTWAAGLRAERFPLVLYGVNGLLPLAICLFQGMVPAGVAGALAMGLPLWFAWLAPVRGMARAATSSPAASPAVATVRRSPR